MRSQAEINIINALKSEGKSFKEISDILKISRNSVMHLYYYDRKILKKKRGPKFKLSSFEKLRIKRKVAQYKEAHEKVNASKIKKSCYLRISARSIQRYFKSEGYKYCRAKSQIILSKKHKEARLEIITNWITSNHQWDVTVFTDEKRFTLDGTDDWRTYTLRTEQIVRCKRQCKGGGVMVWMMVLPNYLLSFHTIEGKFRSEDYIKLLKEKVLPIIMLNLGKDFFLQQDNAPVHQSKEVKLFLKESNIRTVLWPARSPDINIAEDVWKLISDIVYDGPQFRNKEDLVTAIQNAICHINRQERQKLRSLYASIRSRLCKVLKTGGNLYNK